MRFMAWSSSRSYIIAGLVINLVSLHFIEPCNSREHHRLVIEVPAKVLEVLADASRIQHMQFCFLGSCLGHLTSTSRSPCDIIYVSDKRRHVLLTSPSCQRSKFANERESAASSRLC
ncbi:uncharacterized protein EI90DRAFT_3036696 [Cantharellus anzutake]|uniref:uncharacterized protein n=1 Tax=Cantharellus anzutake TaxID=1750568 RepID=UPI0019035931|nr:uncharacterized protein EI90DRAFT_3036696 [Cantharellus anzutake]KAF8340735.1 hypothetical protein EI90DRAFT_3036696 [Cantharellus anzutake]